MSVRRPKFWRQHLSCKRLNSFAKDLIPLTSLSFSHNGHRNDGHSHMAKLTITPMTTVRMQPTAVYHRNDNLNIGLSSSLHQQAIAIQVLTYILYTAE